MLMVPSGNNMVSLYPLQGYGAIFCRKKWQQNKYDIIYLHLCHVLRSHFTPKITINMTPYPRQHIATLKAVLTEAI